MIRRANGPVEADEQMMLMKWAAYSRGKYPELAMLFHIPNGGSRNRIEAARLKAQGVCPGVPDLCLPVARGAYHGLFIELKRQKGGRLSDEQKGWLDALGRNGYRAIRCDGWAKAAEEIARYLGEGVR
jgi:hypothetical protein